MKITKNGREAIPAQNHFYPKEISARKSKISMRKQTAFCGGTPKDGRTLQKRAETSRYYVSV
jgi:hypothetical protein